MDLFLDPDAKRTATRELFEQLREAIVAGRLAPGDRLPPSRDVAAQLGVSRHTVTTVYGRLAAEGFVAGRAGGGTFVNQVGSRSVGRQRQLVALRPVERLMSPEVWLAGEPTDTPARYDLRAGTPDPALFPLVAWRRCTTTAHQTRPAGYGGPAGLDSLRRAIAHWVGKSRAVDATAEQVVVTAGAQQAIDLVTRVLVRAGEIVAVEDPGYPPVRRLCAALGAVVAPVRVDAHGMVVDEIPHRARAVYATPSHQSPSGATMSLQRRRALLAFAERHDVAVIEDDYDSEYRHVDRPLEPLYRLDRSGRVIYVGTFSKTLSPSLRLGFAVLPESLVAATLNLRRLVGGQPGDAAQSTLLRFIVDGELDRHLRRTRKIYSERHALVTEFVRDAAARGHLLDTVPNNAGLHVTALLPDGIGEEVVRNACRARGVAVGTFDECWSRPDPPAGVILGFGAIATRDLPPALAVVGDVLAEARAAGRT
jgi:GntR family transcriptional regulator/MocR family aminotransferase